MIPFSKNPKIHFKVEPDSAGVKAAKNMGGAKTKRKRAMFHVAILLYINFGHMYSVNVKSNS